jgi:folate-binding protein YgfZ
MSDRPVVAEGRRDVLWVRGADAVTFLQGQLSADVEAIEPRTSAWALLLQPKGMVDAWLRVSRVGDSEVLIDVDEGWGERVEARLRRFMIRVAVEIETGTWRWLAVRGPGSGELPYPTRAVVVADPAWPGIDGLDLVGPDLTQADVPGAIPITGDELETLRVLAGVPAMGRELDEDTIPAEAGQWLIDASVSFTKGCYTGQELVARVDSRGSNTPRRLRRIGLPAGAAEPPTGAEVHSVAADGSTKAVGRVSSVAALPEDGWVALGMLHRSVGPGDELVVAWEGGQEDAVVASEG